MEDDEMDSLFEGMVLFNPSQITSSESPPPPPPPPPPTPTPLPSLPLSPPPSLSSSSSSAPLDVNLFSDLTLITPIDSPNLDPEPPSPSPSVSRQVSRKKKKPGIRIGYGRDTTTLPEEPSPSSITRIQSDVVERNVLEDAHIEIQPPLPTVEAQVMEKINLEDAHVEIQPPLPAIEAEVLESRSFEDAHMEIPVSLCTIEAQDIEKIDLENFNETADVGHEDSAVGASGNSTEGILEQIRSRIAENLEGIRGMAASVSTSRKELSRKRRKAVESVNLASMKYKELEKELEEACEAEDFEKAERLSDSLAAAEKEKEGFLNAMRDAEAECDAFEMKLQEVLELQIAAEEEGVSLLEEFAKDAVDSANSVLKNASEFSLKETAEWMSSSEALEVRKMELEIELHLINDARLGLNDSIEHVVEDDRREQEILYKKQDILKEELDKLLALVRAKEAEIVENDSNIQVVEKRIADAVSGFHDVQSNIDTKYYDMQSIISRMDSERETLSKKKKEIDDFLSQEENRGHELKELANITMDEAKACQKLAVLRKSLALPILKYREVKLRLGKTEAKILEEVQILKQEVSTARASLQELSSTRSNIQQEVTSAKQRIFFIDKRSPELEAEKRVAAATRNFKEAGRIATEMKALGVEKEGIQTKMEADLLHLGMTEEEINNTIKDINEKEELILLKEKEAALLGCERLRLVSATALAERSAALELDDFEEATTLLAEAEAAASEALQLQQAYDFKEEEFENTAKDLISIELIANLGGKQLADMASLVTPSAV